MVINDLSRNNISRNDPCWCGSGKKWKKCHYPIKNPQEKISKKDYYLKNYNIRLKNENEVQGIKASAKIAAKILDELCNYAKEGVTTQELDDLSMQLHKSYNVIPAPLGYGEPPFPKSICTSLNEVICHGIPNNTPLKNGDILNIDVTTILNGFYGDCSRMVLIGDVTKEKKQLVQASYECLMESIKICKPGVNISEIGSMIEKVAEKYDYSVVYQFVGHGIGIEFHEPPQIPHCYNDVEIPLEENMIFTIEPMINMGVREAVINKKDKWTARTKDLLPSAQWEHTILITKTSHEILTIF